MELDMKGSEEANQCARLLQVLQETTGSGPGGFEPHVNAGSLNSNMPQRS